MSFFTKIGILMKWPPTFQNTRLFTQLPKPERKKIVLRDEDLIETFVKGSGPGGQCINKRSSCVDLRHIPTGLRVQCQQSRSLADNRGIARKLLREKLDELENGSLSKVAKKAAKIMKQKARRAKRAKAKYGAKPDENNAVDHSVLSSETPAKPPTTT
ncbi:RF-1 domain-containing protein [Sporodiniella umbellata]|nr:RF-1 domain-containing protein [Sporodiniella umbellata]